MANYTYTTNAQQEADIAAQLDQVNTQRAAQGLAAWTKNQMIVNDFGVLLGTYAVTRTTANNQLVLQAWLAATPAQRAAVAADLGVTLV